MEWISVNDRLPEIDEWVQTIDAPYYGKDKDHFHPVACKRIKSKAGKDGWVYQFSGKMLVLITHWMPLPEPPSHP